MNILSYIPELLLLNDCVIIPNFGGLIANHTAASIANTTFSPPNSSVSFNSKLNFNDGLLIHEVSAEENISYIAAKRAIETLVSEIYARLSAGETVEIPKVGSLRYDAHHQIVFTQAENFNLNIHSYGFGTFSYQNLLTSKLSSTLPSRTNAAAIAPTRRSSKALRRALWATPILLLLVAIPFKGEISKWQESNVLSIAPAASQVSPLTNTHTEVEPAEFSNETASMSSEPSTEISAQVNEIAPTENIAPHHYHLIAGSFRDVANADELIAQLKADGIDAVNMGVIRGLNYVSVASFATLEEARLGNVSLTNEHAQLLGTWIYNDAQ
ncbi:MAG: SPOR domain-containing protein [Mangrovibacterium sp.]